VLRAVAGVLKSGGRHIFYVIDLKAGITDQERTRAIRDGNDYVDAGSGYEVLMDKAGFVDIDLVDMSENYLTTLEGWVQTWKDDSASLIELFGADEYNDRMRKRQVDITAVREGLLKRHLVSGTKP